MLAKFEPQLISYFLGVKVNQDVTSHQKLLDFDIKLRVNMTGIWLSPQIRFVCMNGLSRRLCVVTHFEHCLE